MKTPRKGGTHRVMTPMEFMARLAALLPRPRIPRVRYHGVFASRSSWRRRVTPKPPLHAATPKPCAAGAGAPAEPAPQATVRPVPPLFMPPDVPAAPACFEPWVFHGSGKLPAAGSAAPAATVEPTTISVAQWGRLDNGELFARTRYIAWPVLMKRTWGLDVLSCPKCARRLRVVSTITQPDVIRKILDHLGVRSTPLPRGRARDGDWEQTDLGFEAA